MIASFTRTLARRLLAWALASTLIGVALLVLATDFWRGFGLQAGLWGLIDGIIALVALRSARRDAAAPGPPGADAADGPAAAPQGAAAALSDEAAGAPASDPAAAARRIARILWINAALDVLYVAIGGALVVVAGPSHPFLAGNGWGIIVQGGFLLVFDVTHALRVPRPDPTVARASGGGVDL